MAFMKKKTIDIDGSSVEITQLSGLDRFDYLDYVTGLPKPTRPVLPEEATAEQLERYEMDYERSLRELSRMNFLSQSRLVAYGYRSGSENIDERHREVMSTMTPEQIYFLHDEVAKFSGMAQQQAEETPAEPASEGEVTEPVDPKA